jgi:hypothetical protein
MNKIDLIIECMAQILNDELPSPENMMKAFHYAYELRECLHEVNAELLKSALLFHDYMKFMDAGDDVKGMLAFAELVEVNAAAIAKAEVTK